MWVVLALLALLASACGTRLDDSAFAPTTEVVNIEGEQAGAATPGAAKSTTTSTTAAPAARAGGGGGTGGGGTAGGGGGGGAAGPNQASDVGVTETTIRIGNITAENGVLGDAFAPAVRGLRAWVQHTNASGGIHGRQVQLFTCDDREDRSRSLECARRLVEGDKVFALIATNTRSLGGAAEYLHEQGVPVFGFPITNSFYRYPRFFSIYGNYYGVGDGRTVGHNGNLITFSGIYRWFRENLGVSKAAVFSYDIAESAQAGAFIAKGLELEGYDVKEYVVSFAAPSFDQAVAEMQADGTQIMFDAMDDGANRRLCDAMERRRFKPEAKVSTVVAMGDAVGTDYNDTCRNIIHVSGESQPYTSNVAEVAEFRKAYAQYQPGLPLHQWALEAWAIGNIAQEAITSMGPAPTREGFAKFLATMKGGTGNGIMVGTRYIEVDPAVGTHEDCFTINRWQDAKGGWALVSSPFPFCVPDARVYTTPVREQGN